MSRKEFNEKARRDAEAFKKDLADMGLERHLEVHDTDEDYFVHLVRQAISLTYANDMLAQDWADLKALLLLATKAWHLRLIEEAFTPEVTGETAHNEYFSNIVYPTLERLGDDCSPEDREKVLKRIRADLPKQFTFEDLLKETYRAHPGLDLSPGGPEILARRKYFGDRVVEILAPPPSQPKRKRGGSKSNNLNPKQGPASS